MKKLFGVTTAMVTPFDENGKVDVSALKEHAEFLISKGVNCLYPLGTTGEMFRLSVDERKKVAETLVETVAGRVNTFIHVGAMRQDDTIELARHALRIGADGIGVVTPAYFSVNEREMEQYFVAVARSVPDDFPVYLYNIPQCSGNDLKTYIVRKVIEKCPNVVGIKYSYPDFLRTNEYLGLNGGNFSVLHGTDRLFLAALAIGCSGTVSGVSSVYPEPFVALYKAFRKGNLEEARKHQRLAIKYCEALKNGSNMAYFKAALKMRGINAGHMRVPQLDLTPQETEALRNTLKNIENGGKNYEG